MQRKKSGRLKKWVSPLLRKPPPSKRGEVNYSAVDRFTIVHFLIGMGYGFFGFSAALTILLAVAWEVIENPMKVYATFLFPNATADTGQNMLFDVFAVIAGWRVYLLIG